MKKSFMTRVLATGLSLAMAFSLSAATNVSVASAASTPAMASKQFAVRVGGAAKSYKASAATQKSYRISKATVGNTDKATVKVNSSKKSIKVTPGTVAGSTVVKISFKNIKTKKTTSKKYRCVVKAAVVEKQAIVKADVTGVKTITLTMAKDVVSVASPVAITVKKGTIERTCTATAEGKTITLAMENKITAGEYNITVKGLEDAELTAVATAAKDEYLDHFEIAPELIQTSYDVTTQGYVYYSARNQYNERMVSADPTATCTFGVVDKANSKSATATADGYIYVKEIPAIMAIKGVKGQLVLVGEQGVASTGEIAFSEPASAATATYEGTYNTAMSKKQDIAENDLLTNYVILLSFKDQYDHELATRDLATVSATLPGGLTNIELDGAKANPTTLATYFQDIVVDNKQYVALKLKGDTGNYAEAGDATLTVVNNYKGLLLTQNVKVVDSVIIKSVNITAKDGLVYAGQENELVYEITDSNGNAVTDYATLISNPVIFTPSGNITSVRWVKQSDGSAKLIAKVSDYGTIGNDNKKETTLGTFTTYANNSKSVNYLVKTISLTVGENRQVVAANGIKSDVETTFSTAAGSKTIGLDKIVAADQYSNSVVKSDGVYGFPAKIVTGGGIATVPTGVAIYVSDDDQKVIKVDPCTKATKAVIQSGDAILLNPIKAGTAVMYLKYYNRETPATKKFVDDTNYDAKVYLTVTDTDKNIVATTLKIKDVNKGYAVRVNSDGEVNATFDETKVNVVAVTGTGEVKIPSTQYVITSNKNNTITKKEFENGTKTKTATVTVVVNTHDANTNIESTTTLTADYTVSAEDRKLSAITGTIDGKEVSVATLTAASVDLSTGIVSGSALAQLFKYNTNFNDVEDGKTLVEYAATSTTEEKKLNGTKFGIGDVSDVTYDILVDDSIDTHCYTVYNQGTKHAYVLFHDKDNVNSSKDADGVTITVTAKFGTTSKTKTITLHD